MIKSIIEKNNEKILPKGWTQCTLNDICIKIVDGTHFTPRYVSEGIPFISVKDIKNNQISFDNCKYISEDQHRNLSLRCNPEYNDVLITKSGTIGRTAVIKSHDNFSLFVSVALLKPIKKYIVSQFLALALENYINGIDIQQDVKGGVIKNLHIEDLRVIPIFLAPLEEQNRIVLKIEELFSQNENIIKSLKIIKSKLKEYRLSILEVAFMGKLIPNDQSHESSTKRWDIHSKPLESENLPQIPSNWCYRKLKELSERVSVGHVGSTSRYYCDKTMGIPFLRSQNIRPARINFENIRYITKEFHHKLRKSQLSEGDLVIVRVGANRGDTCIIPSDIGQINCANVIFARLFKGISEYLNYYFQSRICQNILNSMTTGSAQGVINTKSVAEVPVPIPPFSEQEKIVTKIEEAFSIISHLEQSIDEAIEKNKKMNKLILSKAFQGKLVPQDPNDEPAEILLQKIKQEKERLQATQRVINTKPIKTRRTKNAK